MAHALSRRTVALNLALRWCARTLSVIILGVFLAWVLGESLDPWKMSRTESLSLTAMFFALAGLAAGWNHEGLGGAMTIGGVAAFYLLMLTARGSVPGGPFFLFVAVPGVLYLICWWRGGTL